MKSLSGWACLVLALAAAITIPLYAQTKVERTEPPANSTNQIAPKQIQVWFSEALPATGTMLKLAGPRGAVKLALPVVDGTSISATVVGDLPDGAYLATWQWAGNGRVQRGQFKFIVKSK